MRTDFRKYHGTGNDFILIDARREDFPFEDFTERVRRNICHRRFGIGADGLIFLRPSEGSDFYMDYYNSDGAVSSMCGNGSRCIVRMARDMGLVGDEVRFDAIDGDHRAAIRGDLISVLLNTGEVRSLGQDSYEVDTGSPHYIQYVDHLEGVDVVGTGRQIRNSEPYRAEGINVNFVERLSPQEIAIATYERGVEDETLSCGTGVTACALTELHLQGIKQGQVRVRARGGNLKVDVISGKNGHEVWLTGPAVYVFSGSLETKDFDFRLPSD